MPTLSGPLRSYRQALLAVLVAAVATLAATVSEAQFGGGGNAAGIMVDAQGVLRARSVPEPGLNKEQRAAVLEGVPGDLREKSPLRKVALSRLEAAVAKAAADGRGIPDEVEKLAGLTRIQYVFVYPADGDNPGEIVIAGPAEPWAADAAGRIRGIDTGAPTLLLQDLATAIRCFGPGQPHDRLVGCSIDPKPQGLAALQEFLKRTGSINPQANVDELVAGMKNALGTQTVKVQGVSPASHFAQVLVEADYRMKLIGIGLEPPPVAMKTWIDLAGGGAISANALQRWYFVPDYQCIRIAEDDLAIELVGEGVKLCSADEVVMPNGQRLGANRADKSSVAFTQAFTKLYPKIAARNPVHAQLRCLIDLAVIAAYMQEHDAYGKAGWEAKTLLDEKTYRIETHPVPKEVETAINAVWRGNRLMTPIGGGVTAYPRMALDPQNLMVDEKEDVAKARATAAKIPETAWYWD